jgi:DNA-binding XRE family transcriptional regulator
MSQKKTFSESDLAALAKEFRLKTGKKKSEAAEELGVSRPTMQLAEETPGQSLTKLRIRIIEKYSPYKVLGPVYMLKRK